MPNIQGLSDAFVIPYLDQDLCCVTVFFCSCRHLVEVGTDLSFGRVRVCHRESLCFGGVVCHVVDCRMVQGLNVKGEQWPWGKRQRVDGHVRLGSRGIMALITITGYPCSGKSRRAQQLREYLESKLGDPEYHGPTLKVGVLSDDNLNLSRSVYDGDWVGALFEFLRSNFLTRQPVGKACPWDIVLRYAEAYGARCPLDRGFTQLHQRFQISDVLCCERNEDKGLHSELLHFSVWCIFNAVQRSRST